MDELRTAAVHAGPLGLDPEAQAFIHDFPKNFGWHFVDLPLGTKSYELDGPFAKPDDVVHSIEMAAVSVLEGGDDSRISKKMALRMIGHFVGDLHQPLHCTSGYYIVSGGQNGEADEAGPPRRQRVSRATRAATCSHLSGPVKFRRAAQLLGLHGLPTKITGNNYTAELVKVLAPKVAAEGAGWASKGDYHHWPEAWATESLVKPPRSPLCKGSNHVRGHRRRKGSRRAVYYKIAITSFPTMTRRPVPRLPSERLAQRRHTISPSS